MPGREELPVRETATAPFHVDSIRRRPHAMLLSTGCLLGRFICHAVAANRDGPVLVVQNCTEHRVPDGPAIWVGPVAGAEDLAAVRRWLDDGKPSKERLPAHLDLNPPAAN